MIDPMILTITLISTSILVIIFVFLSAQEAGRLKKEKERYEQVILGSKEKKVKTGNKTKLKKKKKRNFILRMIDDYVFYGGTKRQFLLKAVVGYLIMVGIYFLLSSNIQISLILGLYYIVVFYNMLDNKLKKQRMAYIKGFVSALDVISASFQVGNSLEESMKLVSVRENIDPIVKREFTMVRNSLIVGASLEEALKDFAFRNKMYEEPTMFAIILQFYAKSGGEKLEEVFISLQESLVQKKENYSVIEGNLFVYNALFNVVLYGLLATTLIAPFILSGFYEDLATTFGTVRTIGSVLLTLFAVYMFKGFTKKAAEGN